ncbi:Methionyl-tRNA formyltransferase [Tulasnella sp. 419]|nr:Methionyl-tRNA formyltransferase [Tulasnella sp. 419]
MLVRFSLLPRLSPTRKWACNLRCYSTRKGDGPLKILFFGRGEFSCDSFKELYHANDVWKTIDIVTTPDELIDKKRYVSKSPLRLLGDELELPVHLMPRSSDQTWQLPDPFQTPLPNDHILISSSWGRAVPSDILSNFTYRFNIHPSLLPKYRGPAPIQWTIANGDMDTGVSIIQMEEVGKGKGFDQGDVFATKKMAMPIGATYETLEPLLAKEGGALLVDVLRDFITGKITRTTQDHVLATRAPLIRLKHATIDWKEWSSEMVVNRYRGFGQQQPLHTTYIHPVQSTDHRIELYDITHPPLESPEPRSELMYPGEAILLRLSKTQKVLVVRCADGKDVWIRDVKPDNKKKLVNVGEWWNGVKVQKGGVLELGKENEKLDANLFPDVASLVLDQAK